MKLKYEFNEMVEVTDGPYKGKKGWVDTTCSTEECYLVIISADQQMLIEVENLKKLVKE